jgi:hypothetical protein
VPELTLAASAISYGQTLGNSSLAGSSATNGVNGLAVGGSFAFEDGSIAPQAGVTNVAVVFTPSDTDDFVIVTNTVNVTVNPAQSTTTIASSMNPSVLGQTVSLTVIVAPVLPATTTPTGSIQFYTNGVAFAGPVPLSAGTATLSTPLLPQGSSTVTSVYLNDPNFLTSSDSLIQTVTVSQPATTGLTNNGNGTITVTFNGTPGGRYLVQATDDLSPASWSNVSTNIAGADGQWTYSEPMGAHDKRFFRSAAQ